MASQEGLPPGQRFKRSIDYRNEQKEAGIEAERAEGQDEALRLGRDALQEDEEVQRHSLTPHSSTPTENQQERRKDNLRAGSK